MNNNLLTKFILPLFLLFVLAGISENSFAQKSKIYKPKDVPVPVLDSTGFIIDPEKKIDPEWHREMIYARETYYFNRYIEPVCVRIDNISDPDDLDAFADKLVELWDLEKKTNGRFVFQIHCKSKKKVVFRIGSRLKVFYSKSFLNNLAADIESIHFAGDAVGTGDFVSMQKLGDHVFEEIRYDSKLSTYQGNTGIHSQYPDRVERSNGQLSNMSWCPYGPEDPIWVDVPEGVIIESEGDVLIETGVDASLKNYFSGLSQDEIDQNFAAINTSGKITDIHQVPNAREINNSHITDPHNMLSDFAENMINGLLNDLEDSAGYQVAVVCLNSIGDNDARVWGTDLFNLWGIGSKETENGLLMLLIHDIHGIDFITGRGTEGILTDVDCYNIQQEEMVPHFKNDDYATGMIRGTQAVCDFFYGSPPLYSSSTDQSYDSSYDEPYYEEEPYNFFQSDIWGIYVMATGIMTAAWLVVFIICFFIRDLHKRYYTLKFFALTAWPFVFPVPFAILYFFNKSMMERWRNTIRFSPTTGEEMHKLDDHAEDKHLAKGQLTEEKVKSIDYDVWVSYGGKEVLVLAYKKWFSKYNSCPSCKFKTYWKEYDRTISAATYDSSGTGERRYKCESCGHSKTERYTIPRKTRSSSSSSGGSSYGGSSSFSGGGGGSSYGGGSSRGGGSGSRW